MPENKSIGKITKGVGGLYTVMTDGEELSCRARGIFRHSRITPQVGDMVELGIDEKDGSAVIEGIMERKNSLIRPSVANMDYVFVTMASKSPEPMLDMTDKLISILEFNNIEPVIIVGKCELDPTRAEEIRQIYSSAGFNVFVLSCAENIGIDRVSAFIEENLCGKTAAFAGASGVGKSTLMNKLFPSLSLDTSQVSHKIERGRHTTRTVTLYPVIEGGGYIADTPGFSMLDFERFDFFDREDLVETFREYVPHIGECRYTKCTHTKEEGCAILEAIMRGEIPKSRHNSYLVLYDVLKNKHKWDKKD